MYIFLVLCGVHAFAYFFISIQLCLVRNKATSRKIIIPLVIAVATSFILLVAIDFFIEVHLLHMTPKQSYTQDKSIKKPEEESKKKKGKGFKLGYLIIYTTMCIVGCFMYLAFKDLEEEIEKRKKDNEPMEITISHIF